MNKKILWMIFFIGFQQSFATVLYVVRHIKQSDAISLKTLYHRSILSSNNLALLVHEVTDEYIDDLIHGAITHGLGLVVELDGQLIGWMIKHCYPFKTSRHVFYGGSIGVHPDFRGQGIGTVLISQFLSEVATKRPDILRVEIYALESNPAYRLYKRLGFVEEGMLKDGKIYADGRLESYYYMVWFNPNFDAQEAVKSAEVSVRKI